MSLGEVNIRYTGGETAWDNSDEKAAKGVFQSRRKE
jgi:hypothetical protein